LAWTHTFQDKEHITRFLLCFFRTKDILQSSHAVVSGNYNLIFFWQKWTKYFIIGLIKEFYCVFLHKLSTLETLNFLDLNMICSNVSSFSSRCWLRWLASFFFPSFSFNVGVSLLSISLEMKNKKNSWDFSLVLHGNS
jgi:hypothetical protein